MALPEKVAIIQFGLRGHTFEFYPVEGCSARLTGYSNPLTLPKDVAKGEYKNYDLEGATVIDVRGVVSNNPGLAFKSPICKPGQPIERFRDLARESSAMFLSGVMHANRGNVASLIMAKALTDEEFTGLDSVDERTYAEWWRKHGARIGTWMLGGIWWDGEPIRGKIAAEPLPHAE